MRWAFAVIGGCLLAIAGCEAKYVPTPTAPGPAPGGAAASQATGATLKPEAIVLKTGDNQTLEEMVAANQGKVVFVDYWATWCGPCVEYFPHTVELHEKYKDQGYKTIAVNFDELAMEQEVRQFLAEKGADFEHLVSKFDGVSTEAAENFDVSELPQFRLYDRQGKLRHKWSGKPEEVEAKIEELLAEKEESGP